ncbi:MAG: hypothetical protein BGO27_03550 [Alphaproteobacteria bacterium 33-17]|nr:MAG: hypothetical protein BGO27_03550 [Alphaproteobacteria bacterium 33-17]
MSELNTIDLNFEGLNDEQKEVYDKYIREFIIANPYPTYDEIYKYIFYHNVDKFDLILYGQWCSYNEYNHFLMKCIYEKKFYKEKIKEIGHIIYKCWGIKVMKDIYNLMKVVYLKMFLKHEALECYHKYFIYLIDQAWSEIDEWKHAHLKNKK